ncbi:uncharacterized protein LOC134229636 isoform X3 [Saccostrea cucullata]|uniref:uncharacterized protein LOC134229636 isoform X3 n=1 Tax=Saccostrea cuccullata TaxID=36930 RepID=UPI002ED6AD3F
MDPRTSAQDMMQCDLCETAVIQMHCDTCFVNLCKACVGEHFSADLSKPHKIVHFKNKNKSTLIHPRCTSHEEETCKIFCTHCDVPICTICLASDQHLGHKLARILEIRDKKRDKLIKEQTELKEKIYPNYQVIATDVQNRMSQLEKEYGDLSTAITKHGEDWHREIDKHVKKLKAEVDEMKNTQLQTLQNYLDGINKTMSDIKDEINSVDSVLESTDISSLFSVPSTLDRYTNLPRKITVTIPKFIPKKLQADQLFSLETISLKSDEHDDSMKTTQKSPEAVSSPPVKQLLDEPETVTTIHTGYTGIFNGLYNVACLSDEEIWTRGNDRTMKLYSINQGSLLKPITTKSGNDPTDIAVIKSGDLVYTDYHDRTVNIVKKIEEVIRLQNWRPRGVCSTFSDDLLVTMESDDYKQSKVVRYSGSTEKQTIQFDDKGKPLYSSGRYNTYYINENRNLDICVSDCGAVVVVNQAGKLRFRYTGHTPAPKNQPFSPQGITTDSQSHILTADYNNDCIHIIDKDGQFLRYIDCGLSKPWGLCVDTNDNLFVAQYGNRQVKKIKYLQ